MKDRGELAGLEIDEQFLLSLADIRSDGNIQPLPSMTVRKVRIPCRKGSRGGGPACGHAPRSLQRARLGESRAVAEDCERERGANPHRATDGARQAIRCPPVQRLRVGGSVQDLFLVTYRRHAVAREVIEENNRDIRTQLASLRFYDLKHDCATHAGALLFAKDPLDWLPRSLPPVHPPQGQEPQRRRDQRAEIHRRIFSLSCENSMGSLRSRSRDVPSQPRPCASGS